MSLFTENYFVLFGLKERFEQSSQEIKQNYLKLQQRVHPDRFAQASSQVARLAVDYAAEINLAYRTLLSPILRAIYLLKQRNIEWKDEKSVTLPNDFLMEQIDFREQLADCQSTQNQAHLENIKQAIQTKMQALMNELTAYLDDEKKEYDKAVMNIHKMQFYAKLAQEVDVCLF